MPHRVTRPPVDVPDAAHGTSTFVTPPAGPDAMGPQPTRPRRLEWSLHTVALRPLCMTRYRKKLQNDSGRQEKAQPPSMARSAMDMKPPRNPQADHLSPLGELDALARWLNHPSPTDATAPTSPCRAGTRLRSTEKFGAPTTFHIVGISQLLGKLVKRCPVITLFSNPDIREINKPLMHCRNFRCHENVYIEKKYRTPTFHNRHLVAKLE